MSALPQRCVIDWWNRNWAPNTQSFPRVFPSLVIEKVWRQCVSGSVQRCACLYVCSRVCGFSVLARLTNCALFISAGEKCTVLARVEIRLKYCMGDLYLSTHPSRNVTIVCNFNPINTVWFMPAWEKNAWVKYASEPTTSHQALYLTHFERLLASLPLLVIVALLLSAGVEYYSFSLCLFCLSNTKH